MAFKLRSFRLDDLSDQNLSRIAKSLRRKNRSAAARFILRRVVFDERGRVVGFFTQHYRKLKAGGPLVRR